MNEATHPERYPVLPLKNSVLFPEMMMPLVAGRPISIAAVEEASSSEDKSLVVVSQKDLSVEEPTLDDLFPVGTLAVIKKLDRSQAGVQAHRPGPRAGPAVAHGTGGGQTLFDRPGRTPSRPGG